MQKFIDKVYGWVMATDDAAARPAGQKNIIVAILFLFLIAFVITTIGFMKENITL